MVEVPARYLIISQYKCATKAAGPFRSVGQGYTNPKLVKLVKQCSNADYIRGASPFLGKLHSHGNLCPRELDKQILEWFLCGVVDLSLQVHNGKALWEWFPVLTVIIGTGFCDVVHTPVTRNRKS